ncbi:hypothetical protein DFH06DRAFT_1121204 [Mycena polygramma]|nr:hypothetical protein DFH06DRAFT_1121204 [Mycena polygramma]
MWRTLSTREGINEREKQAEGWPHLEFHGCILHLWIMDPARTVRMHMDAKRVAQCFWGRDGAHREPKPLSAGDFNKAFLWATLVCHSKNQGKSRRFETVDSRFGRFPRNKWHKRQIYRPRDLPCASARRLLFTNVSTLVVLPYVPLITTFLEPKAYKICIHGRFRHFLNPEPPVQFGVRTDNFLQFFSALKWVKSCSSHVKSVWVACKRENGCVQHPIRNDVLSMSNHFAIKTQHTSPTEQHLE